MISYSESDRIADALVGRSIVKAEYKTVAGEYYGTAEAATLTLDDDTELHVFPNAGCGGCGSGWFEVDSIAAFPNVITRVEVVDEDGEPNEDADEILKINVYAEGASATVVQVSGSEGNGYYGRGYELRVVRSGDPS